MKMLFPLILLSLLTSCTTLMQRSPNKLRIIQDPESGIVFPELPDGDLGREILYGRELIVNTSYYLGKKGVIKALLKNNVNCQSCHLDAGTRLYGNHLLLSYKRYPGYFARIGSITTLEERIKTCISDHYLDTKGNLNNRELQSLKSYLHWISQSRIEAIEEVKSVFFSMDAPGRKSSKERGKKVYLQHCMRCHGKNGSGEKISDTSLLLYPPLWGENGYSVSSPFFQSFKLAQFIRANMPFGASAQNPILSEEESLDVAVFINSLKSHPRWGVNTVKAYPNILEKPFDYAIGPYPDPYPALQHQVGPFGPILEYRLTKKLPTLN